ncbi:hypothetical protein Trydic_g12021, partial [Trypoxylus dichotomus]
MVRASETPSDFWKVVKVLKRQRVPEDGPSSR